MYTHIHEHIYIITILMIEDKHLLCDIDKPRRSFVYGCDFTFTFYK